MYWTLELASKLEDAPWPATKDELIDYAQRSGAPLEVIENLQEIEEDGEVFESIEDIWPDYPVRRTSFLTKTNTDWRTDKRGHLMIMYEMAFFIFEIHFESIPVSGRDTVFRRFSVPLALLHLYPPYTLLISTPKFINVGLREQ